MKSIEIRLFVCEKEVDVIIKSLRKYAKEEKKCKWKVQSAKSMIDLISYQSRKQGYDFDENNYRL